MAEVKFKITNNDPVSGKRMIAYLTSAPLSVGGFPLFVQYLVKLKEVDESTDAIPAGNTDRAKQAVASFESAQYAINGRKISSITKLYLPDNTVDVNAITLQDYFANKIVTSFSGVGGSDPLSKLAEGILREVISIQQANGELPT